MKHIRKPVKHPAIKGFTLLEIMIALLIISVGLVAFSILQAKLTGYSTMAKQRTIAMNLAEQQIETMHSFYIMGATGVGACSTAQSGFDDLATCSTETTVSVGNMEFDLTWNIVSYVQNSDGTTAVYDPESGVQRPDLKLVTINVAWSDGKGAAKNIELVDIVDGTPIFNTGRVSARVDSNAKPKVPYDSADFPGVVEIAIGDDRLKGSTTPEPKIVNKGTNVITTFNVVTFLQTGVNNGYLQRLEEFKVVNCICTMNTGTDTGREPTIWDGKEYSLGALVSDKRTGSCTSSDPCAPSESDPSGRQPSACIMCCNDHHDASDANDQYDSFRPAFSGDAGGFDFEGDHDHYDIVNGTKVLAVESDDYVEACRYIRKDGLFRLATDLSIENLDVVKEVYLDGHESDYSGSVVNFVTSFFTDIGVDTYPLIVPDGSYSFTGDPLRLWEFAQVDRRQAVSRGIYVDYMTEDLLKKIKCLQSDRVNFGDHCNPLRDRSWLETLPFFDLDVTSLADWTVASTAIEVTNSPISDIGSSRFSRGNVSLSNTPFNVVTFVEADIEHSNTGLTDTNPVDPDDEDGESHDLSVSVWNWNSGTPPAEGALVWGNILAGSRQINVETVRLRQDPPDRDCDLLSIEGVKAYGCDLTPTPANGTVTISDYNAVKITGISSTVLDRKVCASGAAFSSITVFDDGIMADPDLFIAGEHTVLTFANLDADAIVNITIVDQDDNCP